MTAFSMETHPQHTADRLTAFANLFGESNGGFAGERASDGIPPIDLFHYPPGPGSRPFHTLITNGMSDQQMNFPNHFPIERRRAEIVLYAAEPKDEYFRWIKWAAHFPFIDNTYLDHGHTVRWHEPLFPGSRLTHMLFLEPIIRGDRELSASLSVEGDPVQLLWFVPITAAEWQLKQEKGVGALLDVFDERKHPLALDEGRESYV